MLLNDHLSETARRHALELIDRNAQAQAQLVNDLVDMSRMTTGKLQVELEPLPLVPVLEAALESVRPAADAKDLSIDTAWQVQRRQRPGRRDAPAAGAVEPAVERGQVHTRRRAASR